MVYSSINIATVIFTPCSYANTVYANRRRKGSPKCRLYYTILYYIKKYRREERSWRSLSAARVRRRLESPLPSAPCPSSPPPQWAHLYPPQSPSKYRWERKRKKKKIISHLSVPWHASCPLSVPLLPVSASLPQVLLAPLHSYPFYSIYITKRLVGFQRALEADEEPVKGYPLSQLWATKKKKLYRFHFNNKLTNLTKGNCISNDKSISLRCSSAVHGSLWPWCVLQ